MIKNVQPVSKDLFLEQIIKKGKKNKKQINKWEKKRARRGLEIMVKENKITEKEYLKMLKEL